MESLYYNATSTCDLILKQKEEIKDIMNRIEILIDSLCQPFTGEPDAFFVIAHNKLDEYELLYELIENHISAVKEQIESTAFKTADYYIDYYNKEDSKRK